MVIMNYNPEDGQLTLKSLTLLDFGPDDGREFQLQLGV